MNTIVLYAADIAFIVILAAFAVTAAALAVFGILGLVEMWQEMKR